MQTAIARETGTLRRVSRRALILSGHKNDVFTVVRKTENSAQTHNVYINERCGCQDQAGWREGYRDDPHTHEGGLSLARLQKMCAKNENVTTAFWQHT
jgi:hypothetical protein